MKKLLEILGWYGACAIIGAYALVSFSIISSNSALYQSLNLTGAIGIVAVSLAKKHISQRYSILSGLLLPLLLY